MSTTSFICMVAVKMCREELFFWDSLVFGKMPREIAKCKTELSRLQRLGTPDGVDSWDALRIGWLRFLGKRSSSGCRNSGLVGWETGMRKLNFFTRLLMGGGSGIRLLIAVIRNEVGVLCKKEDEIKRICILLYGVGYHQRQLGYKRSDRGCGAQSACENEWGIIPTTHWEGSGKDSILDASY